MLWRSWPVVCIVGRPLISNVPPLLWLKIILSSLVAVNVKMFPSRSCVLLSLRVRFVFAKLGANEADVAVAALPVVFWFQVGTVPVNPE